MNALNERKSATGLSGNVWFSAPPLQLSTARRSLSSELIVSSLTSGYLHLVDVQARKQYTNVVL